MDTLNLVLTLFDVDPATTVGLGLGAASGVCAFVAAFLKAPAADAGRLYRALYAIVNWGGWNKFHATNADDARRLIR